MSAQQRKYALVEESIGRHGDVLRRMCHAVYPCLPFAEHRLELITFWLSEPQPVPAPSPALSSACVQTRKPAWVQ